ncbi:MAG: hypothetical protein U0638_07475 [Phycisphaerales bacterium]
MSDEIDHRAVSGRRLRLWMVVWLSVLVGVAAFYIMRMLIGMRAT